MPVPDEVREAVCAGIEKALRDISVCEDGDGYSYGILDAIAEARGESDLRGAGDVLRDASADIFDAALSALAAEGWKCVPVEATDAMMDAGVDAARRQLPPLEEKPPGFVQMRAAWTAMLSASQAKEQAP